MRLLIIGRLNGQIGAASRIAVAQGARVLHADDIDTALKSLRSGEGAAAVLADASLDIADLIARLTTERISVPVLACGAPGDSRAAVAAIKAGAQEYVPLPPDPEVMGAILSTLCRDNQSIVHADPKTQAVLSLARRIAASEASVLITGPSGTGKEMFARFIHEHSRRSRARFVAVNCAAIPEALMESELFGHEKGAFTGAVARRIGRFEEACGGTLLLDEISEMDPRLQAKLLRAIQEREIDRVGGSSPVKVDVRILATSNRRLEDEVAHGRFRADLYFRLNVVCLQLPALADRPLDIPVLARHFANHYARLNGYDAMQLSADALRKLATHTWPGNVRELENTVHRAILLATGERIDADAILLPETTSTLASPAASVASAPRSADTTDHASHSEGGLVGRTVAEVERDLIIDTLRYCVGNRTQAATLLGISIRTLRNKLRQYLDEGLDVPAPGEPLRMRVPS